MQNLWKKNKKYLLFIVIILVIGLVIGIFYYNFQSNNLKNDIINTLYSYQTFHYNAIFKDLIIMSLLLVSSFLIIGLPLALFYILYEGISLGFLISIFTSAFKIKGIIYLIIYLLINKIITFILILFFLKKVINITRYTIGYILYKRDSLIKEKLVNNFISSLYYIVFVFIINIILYFISIPLFNHLSFLLH